MGASLIQTSEDYTHTKTTKQNDISYHNKQYLCIPTIWSYVHLCQTSILPTIKLQSSLTHEIQISILQAQTAGGVLGSVASTLHCLEVVIPGLTQSEMGTRLFWES